MSGDCSNIMVTFHPNQTHRIPNPNIEAARLPGKFGAQVATRCEVSNELLNYLLQSTF